MCVGRFDLRHFRARLRQNFVHAEGKSECIAACALRFVGDNSKAKAITPQNRRMWRNGRRESFKSFSFFDGVGSSPIIRILFFFQRMYTTFVFFIASTIEAWQSVPLMSLHLPFTGSVLSVNIWL